MPSAVLALLEVYWIRDGKVCATGAEPGVLQHSLTMRPLPLRRSLRFCTWPRHVAKFQAPTQLPCMLAPLCLWRDYAKDKARHLLRGDLV